MRVFRRLSSKVRETGFLYTAQLLVERLVPRALLDIRSVYLCRLDLTPFSDPDHHDPAIDFAGSELGELLEDHPVLADMNGKASPGTRLWVLREGGEVAAFMWMDAATIQLSDWIHFTLSDSEIAGIFLWVSPARRGAGLGPRVNRHVSHECTKEGLTGVLSTVDTLNRNSLRADEKVGYVRIGRVRALRILGFALVRYGGMTRLGRWSARRPLTLAVSDLERVLHPDSA
jgi:GNAT superfamily N-acetyltransferase